MKKQPQRTCMGCNEKKDKKDLIRIVKNKDNEISIDRTGKKEGRGAYICDDVNCLEKVIKSKRLERGLIGLAMKAGKVAFGADSVEESILKRKVKLVIVSKESSERTKSKFSKICEKYNIPIIIDGNIEEISKSIGKNNKAVIGIKDINFANSIQKKYNGGDVIG